MKLEKMVTSLETSQKLKELGIEQNEMPQWGKISYDSEIEALTEYDVFASTEFECRAFTFEDITKLLDNHGIWQVSPRIEGGYLAENGAHSVRGKKPTEALGLLLVKVLEEWKGQKRS